MAERTNPGSRGGNMWITTAWITATVLILLTPLVAMQFTTEVNWTVGDFVFAGAMLLGAGVTYELSARIGGHAYQAGVVAALGAGILTLWVTGAVGIIGSENNPANLAYLATVALAVAGAILAQGKAGRMVWAMTLTALATVAAPLVGYAGFDAAQSDVLAPEVVLATGVLAAGWAFSAFFFGKAAKQ